MEYRAVSIPNLKAAILKMRMFIPRMISVMVKEVRFSVYKACLLYTSDAADERSSVDLGGRRIIKQKKTKKRKKKKTTKQINKYRSELENEH